jgi:hypothetical protein
MYPKDDVPRATLSLFRLGLVSDVQMVDRLANLGPNPPLESKSGKVRNRRVPDGNYTIANGRSCPISDLRADGFERLSRVDCGPSRVS